MNEDSKQAIQRATVALEDAYDCVHKECCATPFQTLDELYSCDASMMLVTLSQALMRVETAFIRGNNPQTQHHMQGTFQQG